VEPDSISGIGWEESRESGLFVRGGFQEHIERGSGGIQPQEGTSLCKRRQKFKRDGRGERGVVNLGGRYGRKK